MAVREVPPALTRYTPQGRKRARYLLNTAYAGLPGYLDPPPIRDHINTLHAHGLPLASIARDAGLNEHSVYRIHAGLHDSVRVRAAVALMAVTHHPNERQAVVLAIGALRRLRALHSLGWSWRAIAHHLPLSEYRVCQLVTRQQVTVTWQHWAAIRDAYEKLSGTAGPSVRARNAADRRGWPTPLDWEGVDIDDPRVTVAPSRLHAAHGRVAKAEQRSRADDRRAAVAARRAKVAELTAAGFSAAEIAVRLGVTQRTVVRDRGELDAA